jgi:cytochrome c
MRKGSVLAKSRMRRRQVYGVGARATASAGVTALVIAALASGTQAMAADVEHGKQVFQACAACHTDKPDALGPSLKGVVGRKSAVLEDFRYSGPMRRANLVWDDANLRQFLADPQTKVAGTRMPFGGLSNPKDVDDVLAYLATLK